MRMKFFMAALATASLVTFASCSKDEGKDKPEPPTDVTITGFAPLTAKGGASITITGTNFSETAEENIVTLNDIEAAVTSASATQLVVTVPSTVYCSGKVRVAVGDKNAESAESFAYLLAHLVYTAGYEYDENYVSEAKIWAGSSATTLGDKGVDGDLESEVRSIFISGTDVYAAGNQQNSSYQPRGASWRNGSALASLTDATKRTSANAICVTGTDVHVVGNSGSTSNACYWKNGALTALTTTGGQALSMSLLGSDIYVAGNSGASAVCWTITASGAITPVTLAAYGKATAVFVSGTDVYAAGVSKPDALGTNTPKVWKNGTQFAELNDGSASVDIKSIFVYNGSAYVVGLYNDTPRLWTVDGDGNVTVTPITGAGGVYSVFVKDDVVYVSGMGGNKAMYWKIINGEVVGSEDITNGTRTAEAYAIYVTDAPES